jgi:hypothetical protein
VERADDGFEDREGHQAPITLRKLRLGPHRFDQRIGIRELTGRELGMQDLPIDGDLKGAAAGRDQLERTDVLLELQEFLRQTDGMGLVVSSGAVFDADLDTHGLCDWLRT